jgi:putative redox protein
MKHAIEAGWMGQMQFNALVNGHTVVMDAPERVGGEDHGPIPKPFVLSALSGCTGMDVVSILRKAGKSVDNLSIKVDGEISTQQPIVYTSVHITYEFSGPIAVREDALKAVEVSQSAYCGVSHMLKRIMPVTWDVMYNNELAFTNKTAGTAVA